MGWKDRICTFLNANPRDIYSSRNDEIDAPKAALYHSAMTQKPTADVAGALAAIRAKPARGRGRKSPAYVWLHAHHDALAKGFDETPPSWIALAKYLGDNGITNTDGNAPTASSLRSAWLRVVRDVGRRRAGKPFKRLTDPQTPVVTGEPVDVPAPSKPTTEDIRDDDEPATTPQFKRSRPR
jgi:hypothetical protein